MEKSKMKADHSQMVRKMSPSNRSDKDVSFRKFDKGFHPLSHQILQYANQGPLRPHFQQEVSRMIIDFSGLDGVELWLRDHDQYFRCMAYRHPDSSLSFEITPCPQNEKGELVPGPEDDPTLISLCRDILLGDTELSHPGFSKRGGYRSGAVKKSHPSHPKHKKSSLHVLNLTGDYQSLAFIPLRVNHQNIGLLQLKSKNKNYFSTDKIEFYENLAQTMGIALAHRRIQVDLRERIKELTCLYGIARLATQSNLSLKEILQGIVELLPPAWLYPEIARGRILLDGNSFTTPLFREGKYRQEADIVVSGDLRGRVEIIYLEERPELDEGPFLREERALLDTIAKEIANIIIRRQAEQDKLNLEEQLRHADRLATIGQLAAGVAHELNEPLGSILGFSQLVEKSPGLPDQVKRDIGKIVNASFSAKEIVKKLLIFARQMPPQKVKVNLNRLVEEGLNFFKSRCAKEGVELSCSLSADLPEVDADPSQLNQVLINLVVNALQAMPQGGELKVQTLSEGNQVSLMIEDTGIGMSEEVLEKIFAPFFTTKEVGKGTGLGLPVAHGIVSYHGGSINVKSKVGQGTRFEIRLPVTGRT
jgi:signal transduction histidine kinase